MKIAGIFVIGTIAFLSASGLVESTDFSCTFERNDCGFTQTMSGSSESQLFGWSRMPPPTTNEVAAPGWDHTRGTEKGWFVGVDTRPGSPGTSATFTSPSLSCQGQECCFRFYYNINGNSRGTIKAVLRQWGIQAPIILLGGESLGSSWHKFETTINPIAGFEIQFVATRANSPQNSIMAIDDFSITDGSCSQGSEDVTRNLYSELPWKCTFDSEDMCGMEQVVDIDTMNWAMNQGSTPTEGTGPSSGAEDTRTYIFVESSLQTMATAYIATPIFPVAAFDVTASCVDVNFFYNMFGDTIGSLRILVQYYSAVDVSEAQLWTSIDTTRDAAWHRGHARVFMGNFPTFVSGRQVSNVRFVFMAENINGPRSDIAIDQISLEIVSCLTPATVDTDPDFACSAVAPYPNAKLGGEVLTWFETKNVSVCEDSCRVMTECRAVSYQSSTKVCKHFQTPTSINHNVPDHSTSVMNCKRTCLAMQYMLGNKKNLAVAASIKPVKVIDSIEIQTKPAMCADYCRRDTKCRVAVRFEQTCSLYDDDQWNSNVVASPGRELFGKIGCVEKKNLCDMPDLSFEKIGYASAKIDDFSQGSFIEFACPNSLEYTMTGKPRAICDKENKWTAFPRCDFLGLCSTGAKRLVSQLAPRQAGSFLTIYPTYQFSCDGILSKWQFFAKNRGSPVYLAVWEKTDDPKEFKLVRTNKVTPDKVGLQMYEVPKDEQIQVKAGQFIGFHYDSNSIEISSLVIAHAEKNDPSPYTEAEMVDTAIINEYSDLITPGTVKRITTRQTKSRMPALRGFITSDAKCESEPPKVSMADVVRQETSFVEVKCRDNYVMEGNSQIFCNKISNVWDEPPICHNTVSSGSCGAPPYVPYADYSVTGSGSDTRVEYVCQSPYELVGTRSVSCRVDDNSWSATPLCVLNTLCSSGCPSCNASLPKTSLTPTRHRLAIFTSSGFTCGGTVKRAQYYSNQPGIKFHLGVWRSNAQAYILQHSIKLESTRTEEFEVVDIPRGKFFQVQVGDVLGIHYDTLTDGPVQNSIFGIKPADIPEGFPVDEIHDVLYADRVWMNFQGITGVVGGTILPKAVVPLISVSLAENPGCGQVPFVTGSRSRSSSTGFGSVATYECLGTNTILSGPPSITCLESGAWTERPACISPSECSVGKVVNTPLVASNTWLTVFSNLQIKCAGKLRQWSFHARKIGIAYLSVWRAAVGTPAKFTLVGFNKVTATRIGIANVIISENERISVSTDDVIGIHYNSPSLSTEYQVIGMATKVNPSPYSAPELYDVFTSAQGHSSIIGSNSVEFTADGIKTGYAIPNVQAFVSQTSMVDCGEPSTPENGEVSYTNVLPGSLATYSCPDQFTLSGAKSLTCGNDGKWNAEAPKCSFNEICRVDGMSEERLRNASLFNRVESNMMIFTNVKVGCSGEIGMWMFRSMSEGHSVIASVWAPMGVNSGKESFAFVGSNELTGKRVGINYEIIPKEKRIVVVKDYIIGFHYSSQVPDNLRIIPFADSKTVKTELSNAYSVAMYDQGVRALTDNKLTLTASTKKMAFGIPALIPFVKPESNTAV